MSTKIGILFPGQGAQYVGMEKELLANFPWTRQIYEEASDSIKTKLLKLCQDGPSSDLQLTQNGQPAILTTSYAWFQVLRRELDFVPDAGAGHSLGEYTALLAAGAMELAQAVPLVRERGQRMQTAVPVGTGKMAAVIGLADDLVQKLCEKATEADSVVVPVNFNAPGQVVIAGHTEAVERAEAISKSKNPPELAARKVIPLDVSAPFHSPLMGPVVESFGPALDAVPWKAPRFGIVFNVDAKFRTEPDIPALLKQQVDHPVRWVASMQTLIQTGIQTFVEPGPSKVLAGLMKRIDRNAAVTGIESLEGIKELEALLKETR
ncbi:MAG: ACP S-malonyltransferase [Bdellovibrionales bacterium]|nr:ACP S-malonyltransferase [Bdellovibrionales bacterium]